MSDLSSSFASDPWMRLKRHTAARIGLGRAGAGIPTGETLQFKLAHARARDAVHAGLDHHRLEEGLKEFSLPVHLLHSAARSRTEYLHRPDYGRRLDEESRTLLQTISAIESDLALVIVDGLSAKAIENHAIPFLRAVLPMISDVRLAPLVVVRQGRVAIGDEIGSLLRARCVAVMIGERPGLSSPDSLGIYMTYDPRPGLTDERRNCISNIREEGLLPRLGAEKLAWLFRQSLSRRISGVELKDEMKEPVAGLPVSHCELNDEISR
jgi:ethanolamine ammonia-lyase small subunit